MLIVAFIGVVSFSMLLVMYGPGAAVGFAAGTASRMGADPLSSIVIAVVTFAVVTGIVFRLLSWVYALLLFGASDEQLA